MLKTRFFLGYVLTMLIFFTARSQTIQLIRNNQPYLDYGPITSINDAVGLSFQDLEISNGGWAGVYIWGNASINIDCFGLIVKNTYRGISTDKIHSSRKVRPSLIQIRNCRIDNQIGYKAVWSRREAYTPSIGGAKDEETAPFRNKGIFVCADNSLIENNLITNHFDGIGYQGNHTHIKNNTIDYIVDDGIELESLISSDVNFYQNYITNAFVGISTVSQAPGPLRIYRNVVECTRIDPLDASGFGLKMGENWGCKAQKVWVYHNTFYLGKCSVFERTDDVAPCGSYNNWDDFYFINNLFIANTDRADCNFKGKGANNPGTNNFWYSNSYYHNNPTSESGAFPLNSLVALFLSPEPGAGIKRNLRLKANSQPINTGSLFIIQNTDKTLFPDIITPNEMPDRGAWEYQNDNGTNTYTIGSTINGMSSQARIENEPISYDNNHMESELISVFPNPSTHNITIRLSKNFKLNRDVAITDYLGKVLVSLSFQNKSEITLNLKNYDMLPGMYLIKLKGEEKTVFRKFIVQ